MKNTIAILENHIISTNTVRKKLVQELMANDYNVVILTTGSEEELALAKSFGFTVIDVGSSGTNPMGVVQYLKRLKNIIKQQRINVCLTYTMRPAIWGNMVTRQLQIPTITNITGIGPLAESKSIVYRIARTLYRFVLKNTTKVFFQNEDDKKIFINYGFVKEKQTKVIPGSGVDTAHFVPQEKKDSDDVFKFIFISRLIKDKGILEYVEAAKLLHSSNPAVEFQILGPYYNLNVADLTVTEKDMQEWEKEGYIKYLGAAHDVRQHIANADCVVLPSYREGMSNVLLESSSMEKPLIACNVTGCKEVITHTVTGLLCEPRSGESLATAMKEMLLLSVAERTQMGKKGREKMKQIFEKSIVVNAYIQEINLALMQKR